MAARRAGGGAVGLVIATILFAILFVVSTVLAIVFFTQVKGAEQRAETYETELAALATSTELSQPMLEAMKSDDKQGTIIGKLSKERNALAAIITGVAADRPEQIKAKIANVDPAWNNNTLIDRLADYKGTSEARAQEVGQLKKSDSDELSKVKTDLQAAQQQLGVHKASEAKLAAKISSLQSDLTRYDGDFAKQRKELAARFDKQQAEATKAAADYEAKIKQLNLTIVVKDNRIKSLQNEISGNDVVVQSERIPDGRIVSVSLTEKLAYINIGEQQHVPLGITFEVYDRKTGITKDEFGDWRGKATIEVVNTDESTSTCRIVRMQEGAAISPEDVIQNLVYDPDMKFHFYVFGQFDIDYAGRATDQDRRRVQAMVKDWGGQLDKELGFQTDFLVLGKAPEAPAPLPEDVIEEQVIAEHEAQMKLWKDYQALVGQANELKIPVLNQSRFLALTGYYRR